MTDLEIALRELHHAIYLDPDPEELEGIRERAGRALDCIRSHVNATKDLPPVAFQVGQRIETRGTMTRGVITGIEWTVRYSWTAYNGYKFTYRESELTAPELHVYDFGTEWFVAASVEDAWLEWEEYYEDKRGDDDPDPKELPDDHPLTIGDEDGEDEVTKPCAAWAQERGPGWLAREL